MLIRTDRGDPRICLDSVILCFRQLKHSERHHALLTSKDIWCNCDEVSRNHDLVYWYLPLTRGPATRWAKRLDGCAPFLLGIFALISRLWVSQIQKRVSKVVPQLVTEQILLFPSRSIEHQQNLRRWLWSEFFRGKLPTIEIVCRSPHSHR